MIFLHKFSGITVLPVLMLKISFFLSPENLFHLSLIIRTKSGKIKVFATKNVPVR